MFVVFIASSIFEEVIFISIRMKYSKKVFYQASSLKFGQEREWTPKVESMGISVPFSAVLTS